jgi:general secretion pathway protein E
MCKSPEMTVSTDYLMYGCKSLEARFEVNCMEQATPDDFLVHLRNRERIDDVGLSRIAAVAEASVDALEHVILDLGLLPENVLTEELSEFLQMELMDPELFNLPPDELELFPIEYLRRANLAVLKVGQNSFTVATATPFQVHQIQAMAFQSGKLAKVLLTERGMLAKHLSASAPTVALQGVEDEILKREDIERLRDSAKDAPTIKLLNRIVGEAVERQATDIHIEPREDKVAVRYRLDGAMHHMEHVSKETQAALASRIKILAGMNIAETRLPQDGRMRLVHKGRPVDFRAATSPVIFGENIVLRILDRNNTELKLEPLGFSKIDSTRICNITNSANGLFLVTGPTGSGKSTTLYAVLSNLNGGQKKLFSIEDPVEIRIDGVSQIQTKPQISFDFPDALRAILRQDPDVIMVGEMRDAETARIAVRASMTGHLVLSTLHTNSAVGAVSRLRDMGIENYMIAASLKGILAQRLVRKSCGCGSERTCKACSGSGFAGRTVVYELIETSEAFLNAVSEGQDEAKLQALAVRIGMVSMAEHSKALMRANITTSHEVFQLSLQGAAT